MQDLLGFSQQQSYEYEISNNSCVNLFTNDSLYLKINNFDTLYDNFTDNYYFNKIFFSEKNEEHFVHCCTIIENLINLSYLDIKIYNSYGHFQKNLKDHWFVLEITYLEDRLVGTNIESTRSNFKI